MQSGAIYIPFNNYPFLGTCVKKDDVYQQKAWMFKIHPQHKKKLYDSLSLHFETEKTGSVS